MLARAALARKNASNAFVAVASDAALAQSTSGSLAGLAFAAKDAFCTRDMKTTAASAGLLAYSSPYEATVVELLRAEGAILLGKTNMDEFGMGSFGLHSAHGTTINTTHTAPGAARSAGGSSAGSAVAVAEEVVDFALSTDTGGSTRLPAAFCGIFGFKPSYGMLSRHGLITYATSLDCVGIMSRQLSTLNAVFDTLNHFDSKDPVSIGPGHPARAAPRQHAKQWSDTTIGVPAELFPSGLDKNIRFDIEKTLDLVQKAGARIVPVSVPEVKTALSAYYILALAEASSNLARYDGVRFGNPDAALPGTVNGYRSRSLGAEVRKRLLLGSFALSTNAFESYFLRAQSRRKQLTAALDRLFIGNDAIDFLVQPVSLRFPPTLTKAGRQDSMPDEYRCDLLNTPASLAGSPALSMPIATYDKGHSALQLVGRWGADRELLGYAARLQQLLKRAQP